MKNTKLTYFLRGLGFGIVFVTVIMTVSTKKSASNKVVEKQEMSREDIIAKAKEYGMVEGIGMKVDQLMDATKAPEPTVIPSAQAQTQTAPNKTEEVKQTEAPKTEGSSKGEKSFTIEDGQTASQVAIALESAGLIGDAEKFHKYLEEKGYSTKIIASKHMIPLNASYEEVAKALCEYS